MLRDDTPQCYATAKLYGAWLRTVMHEHMRFSPEPKPKISLKQLKQLPFGSPHILIIRPSTVVTRIDEAMCRGGGINSTTSMNIFSHLPWKLTNDELNS